MLANRGGLCIPFSFSPCQPTYCSGCLQGTYKSTHPMAIGFHCSLESCSTSQCYVGRSRIPAYALSRLWLSPYPICRDTPCVLWHITILARGVRIQGPHPLWRILLSCSVLCKWEIIRENCLYSAQLQTSWDYSAFCVILTIISHFYCWSNQMC